MSVLTVRDLTPAFGAEIEGLPSKGPLDVETVRQLRQLFDERSVLVFRDLDIDEDFQRELVIVIEALPAPRLRTPDENKEQPEAERRDARCADNLLVPGRPCVRLSHLRAS